MHQRNISSILGLLSILIIIPLINAYSCVFDCSNAPYRPVCAKNWDGELRFLPHKCYFKELMCNDPKGYWRFTRKKCWETTTIDIKKTTTPKLQTTDLKKVFCSYYNIIS